MRGRQETPSLFEFTTELFESSNFVDLSHFVDFFFL